MDIIEQTKSKMILVIDHLKNELKSIRTGRANPAMLDNITVDVYGSQMRIKDIASITAADRMLTIMPFDPHNLGMIGKAIEKANLGITPIVEGNLVRVKIPPMDENIRKEMVRLCHKRREEAKVSIRNIRRDSNEIVRKGELAEDSKDFQKKMEKTIQELTDKFCKEVDDLSEKKEKEVSTI
jgi:ribosome recycling factor